jgi:hypothetical protein
MTPTGTRGCTTRMVQFPEVSLTMLLASRYQQEEIK